MFLLLSCLTIQAPAAEATDGGQPDTLAVVVPATESIARQAKGLWPPIPPTTPAYEEQENSAAPLASLDGGAVDRDSSRDLLYNSYAYARGELFRVRFDATEGATRLVSARVRGHVPAQASDELLVINLFVRCRPTDGADSHPMTVARNILRGKSLTLTPSFLFSAPQTGEYVCAANIATGRPRPTGNRPSTNVLHILEGSSLSVSPPKTHVAQAYHPTKASPVLKRTDRRGTTFADFRYTVAPGARRLVVDTSTYLTACTSVSGSGDMVTQRFACQRPHLKHDGGAVTGYLTVMQLDRTLKKACAVTRPWGQKGRRFNISRIVHHLPQNWNHTVTVRRSSRCSERFLVRLSFRWHSGSGMMVHRQATLVRASSA